VDPSSKEGVELQKLGESVDQFYKNTIVLVKKTTNLNVLNGRTYTSMSARRSVSKRDMIRVLDILN
jgi:hypothetical protein